MENIINEMVDNFKGNLQDFFLNGKRSLAEAERYFRKRLSGVVTGLLPAYYEKLNEQIVEDKAGRREVGLQKEQRELRELVRYRKSLVEDRARELNRLQKMLEGANIKLSGTIRDINGMSTRNILNHLVTGKKLDEAAFDEMRQQGKISNCLKAPKSQILDDLNGVLSPLQCRVMKELLSHLDELNEHIRNLDDEIDRFMNPEEHKDDSTQNSPKSAKRKKKRKTAPFSPGLPDPDRAVSLPARSGRVTPLFNPLRPF